MSLEQFGAIRPIIWLRAIRAQFLTASLVPVLAGASLAWYAEGRFDPVLFTLTLFAMACLHAGANLLNDYCDHKSGCDEINVLPTPFSGGSRSIQDGLLSASAVLSGSICFLTIGSIAGLVLFVRTPGPLILLLGLSGILLGYGYSGNPVRLAHRGLGEIAVGLAFGILPVLGSYFVQTGHHSSTVLWVGLPISVLIILVLFLNQFPDYPADRASEKRNLVVRLGRRRAGRIVQIAILLPFLLLALAVFKERLPTVSLGACATFPMALEVAAVARRRYERPGMFISAMAGGVRLHLLFGLVLSATLVADRFLN